MPKDRVREPRVKKRVLEEKPHIKRGLVEISFRFGGGPPKLGGP